MFCNLPDITPFSISYKIKTNFRCQLKDAQAFLEKFFIKNEQKKMCKGH